MRSVLSFIRREPVLTVSALAAGVSCLFVPPDRAYLGYIDLRTLALLYCLMAVVAGLRGAGVFTAMAHALCIRARSVRSICVTLVCLCFFSSMLITNDVALLTFVPFSVVVLGLAGCGQELIRVVVLQTAAANLGSILTPMGNPQNLYLHSYYGLPILEFLSVTFPVWLASLFLLLLLCLSVPPLPLHPQPGDAPEVDRKALAVHSVLFLVCLLTVLRVLTWPVMLAAVAAALLVFDRKLLLKADFPLLLTFAAFFVFAGNLARIGGVYSLLKQLLAGREYLISLLTCQVISNVPAALLLSGFTSNARAVLLGVNIGGLGTPIASLASLISLKLYSRSEHARPGRFLLEFTAVNVLLLLLLSAFQAFLG